MNTTKKKVKSSLAKRNVQKFMANNMAVVGLIGLFLITFMCVAAPLFSENDGVAYNIMDRWSESTVDHPWGADNMGRDLLGRLLYGGRISLYIGIVTALSVNIVGCALGCVAGYFGGKVDKALVVLQEFMSLFPVTLILMLIQGYIEGSAEFLIVLWTITGWGGGMRVVRSRILTLKQEPFIESCRANGISSWSIMFHHMLPNTMGPVIVNVTMNVGGYILAETGLSYLGLGVSEHVPTWGNIINAAKNLSIVQTKPMMWLMPGACICWLVLSCNFFGDGLRDALDSTTR